jgi:hypothetical protein
MVYLSFGLITLLCGALILTHKKVGLSAWQRPFGYKAVWLNERHSQIAGMLLFIWGIIFTVDGLRVVLFEGNQMSPLCYVWGCGWIIWTLGVNLFGYKKYLNK